MKMLKPLLSFLLILSVGFFINCDKEDIPDPNNNNDPTNTDPFAFTIPAFDNGTEIPSKYTCDGSDVSPELKWENPPTGTKGFCIIMVDPDAYTGTWIHWVVFNIPVTTLTFSENINTLPTGASYGTNTWGNLGYGGPCPPGGTGEHNYNFHLYACQFK
jgi:hypothetical protein